jgi:hypothetical protein
MRVCVELSEDSVGRCGGRRRSVGDVSVPTAATARSMLFSPLDLNLYFR